MGGQELPSSLGDPFDVGVLGAGAPDALEVGTLGVEGADVEDVACEKDGAFCGCGELGFSGCVCWSSASS